LEVRRSVSYSFYENLTHWVEMQKKTKEAFANMYDRVLHGDRLDLVIATRAAFQHMIRTLKAFDNWLQDPFIIGHMPREYLEEVWKTAFSMLQQLLDLDIKHTAAFRDYIEKLQKEGKLNPIVTSASMTRGGEEGRGERSVTLSM